MSYTTKIKVCDNHLLALFEAIKSGNVRSIYKIEHELTPFEECVACAYMLRAKGSAREALYKFLESEGWLVNNDQSSDSEAGYWLMQLMLFGGLFALVIFLALGLRLMIFGQEPALNLSSFGWLGVFFLSLSIFVLVEYWIYPD